MSETLRGRIGDPAQDKNSPYVTGRPNHPNADADSFPSLLIEPLTAQRDQ
jgi:hypothetical protein